MRSHSRPMALIIEDAAGAGRSLASSLRAAGCACTLIDVTGDVSASIQRPVDLIIVAMGKRGTSALQAVQVIRLLSAAPIAVMSPGADAERRSIGPYTDLTWIDATTCEARMIKRLMSIASARCEPNQSF
ncbi:MAG: hypothetical protein GC162_14500 [Planctomycetes bacterium]|nr:hypothetical protein [Planctomycetota bacterium]